MLQLMYNGKNMSDEMAVVEVTLDTAKNRIHVYDQQYVCEPSYDYIKKAYTFSEETLKFAEIMFSKKLLATNITKFSLWLESVDWLFYTRKPFILRYFEGQWSYHEWQEVKPFLCEKYQKN